jgi:hypothetical protein
MAGFREFHEALNALAASQEGKVLRGTTMSAALPIQKKAQERVPVGTRVHKTYKGRLAPPGWAKYRKIGRRSLKVKNHRAVVLIGPKKDAFYVSQWLDIGLKAGVSYERKTKRKGTVIVTRTKGVTEHRHWLKDSMESVQDKVIDRWSLQALKRLEKIAAEGYAQSRRRRPRGTR